MVSKLLERIYLDSFLKSIDGNYSNIEERESPDFIIGSGSQSFGVEVTQIFKDRSRRGSKIKKDEAQREKFLIELAKEFYHRGGRPIALKSLILDLPNPSMTQGLLQNLVNESHHLQLWERSKLCIESAFKKYAEFYITRLPDIIGEYSRWICMDNMIGWIQSLDKVLLEKTIQEKSVKIRKYHDVIDNVILLIVIDRIKQSGMMEWGAHEMCCGCGFMSVYLHIFPFETYKVA